MSGMDVDGTPLNATPGPSGLRERLAEFVRGFFAPDDDASDAEAQPWTGPMRKEWRLVSDVPMLVDVPDDPEADVRASREADEEMRTMGPGGSW